MNKKRAFVVLTPGFAAHDQDTIVISLQFFVREFRKQFPEIALNIIAFQYPLFKGEYSWNGANIYAIGGKNRKGFHRLLTWVNAFSVFLKLRKNYRIEGILSIWINECALFGQWVGRIFGLRQISWIFGQDAKPTNKFLKFLRITSDNVVFISCNLVKELNKSRKVKNPIVIPLGIDPNFIDQIFGSERIYDIVGVGSLIELKNYHLFVDLIDELVSEFPQLRCNIVGTGPLRPSLEQLIQKKNLRKNITLTGEKTYTETIALMKQSKILLHTSIYEGQGMVLIEGLCCGLEVVCFDVGFNDPQFMNVCKDKEEMKIKLSCLLKKETSNPKPVILKTMAQSVSEMAALYDL